MNRRANYVVVAESVTELIINDAGPWDVYLTVTNDAESVVANLAPRLRGRRLLCRDSEGEPGELLVRDGEFAGFGPA